MGTSISNGFVSQPHAAENTACELGKDRQWLCWLTRGRHWTLEGQLVFQLLHISLHVLKVKFLGFIFSNHSPFSTAFPRPALVSVHSPMPFRFFLVASPFSSHILFCVFQFLLYSSVNRVVTELKSGNTWTNCMMHESLTATAQGWLFFPVIFPCVWCCFVFQSFSCSDYSLILRLWSFSKLT